MTENDVNITIKCVMSARWAPYFLGMLRQMQRLGSIGSSRKVVFFADGDGDFRPKFEWTIDVPIADGIDARIREDPVEGDLFFDAG